MEEAVPMARPFHGHMVRLLGECILGSGTLIFYLFFLVNVLVHGFWFFVVANTQHRFGIGIGIG